MDKLIITRTLIGSCFLFFPKVKYNNACDIMSDNEKEIQQEVVDNDNQVSNNSSDSNNATLHDKLNSIRKEVIDLKKKLGEISEVKEKRFQERSVINKEISTLIRELKDDREKRDELTKKVRESKDKREEVNKKIKILIDKVKQIGPVQKIVETRGRQQKVDTPKSLLKDIEMLELTIETEALSPTKEKEVTKLIHDKKNKLNKLGGKEAANLNVNEIDHEIKRLKAEANVIHGELQKNADESQKKHEALVQKSKRIDELKNNETKLNDEFLKLKNEYNELNKVSKDKIRELNELRDKETQVRETKQKEVRKERDNTQRDITKDKVKMVHDKMAKGEKLTTEDLIILQGSNY